MGRRIRCHRKGSFYFITRRTIDGLTFFSADFEASVRIFLFVLAVAAANHGVTVLAFALLGNHVHIVLYDERGEIAGFYEYFFKFTALSINSLLRRLGYRAGGKVWDGRSTSERELLHFDDVVDKVIYTIRNPLNHGMIDSVEDYPLFVATIANIAEKRRFRVSRPRYYFSKEGLTPKRPSIVFCHPPGWKLDEWVAFLQNEFDARERGEGDEDDGSESEPEVDEPIEEGESDVVSIGNCVHEGPNYQPDPESVEFDLSLVGLPDFNSALPDLDSLVVDVPLIIRYNEAHVPGTKHGPISTGALQTGLPVLSYPRRMWERLPPFAGPARLKSVADERYSEFRERHRLAKENLRKGVPTPFPAGTVGARKNYQVEVSQLSNREVQTRLEAMRQPVFESEVRLRCGQSTAPVWSDTYHQRAV